jgi:hypothetical protein
MFSWFLPETRAGREGLQSQSGKGAIKYGVDIGGIVADIKKGEHVHIHNLKTRRW